MYVLSDWVIGYWGIGRVVEWSSVWCVVGHSKKESPPSTPSSTPHKVFFFVARVPLHNALSRHSIECELSQTDSTLVQVYCVCANMAKNEQAEEDEE